MPNIAEQIAEMFENGARKVEVTDNYGKRTLRLFKSANGLCYFKKGSSKNGYFISDLSDLSIKAVKAIQPKLSEEQKWIKGWKKVAQKLEESKLWENLLEDINTFLKVGYERVRKANQIYWAEKDSAKQLAIFQKDYPEFISTNDKGLPYINCSRLWMGNNLPIVKAMRFCKGEANDNYLHQIQVAMDNEQKIILCGRTNYDVSFEYHPDRKRASYAEEFKKCGNGHYYLALNATHALFYEDD